MFASVSGCFKAQEFICLFRSFLSLKSVHLTAGLRHPGLHRRNLDLVEEKPRLGETQPRQTGLTGNLALRRFSRFPHPSSRKLHGRLGPRRTLLQGGGGGGGTASGLNEAQKRCKSTRFYGVFTQTHQKPGEELLRPRQSGDDGVCEITCNR